MRTGILDFCGTEIRTRSNNTHKCVRLSVISFDNGEYSKDEVHEGIQTRHSNLLRCYIIGKKSWGLWLNQWAEGVSEWLFTKDEIFKQFEDNGITVPKCLMLDFDNRVRKLRYDT